MIETLSFHRNPSIGLFAFATDSICVAGRIAEKRKELMEKTLGVPVLMTPMMGTDLAGIFCAGNSSGLVVSDRLYEKEIESLKRKTDVLVLETHFTATGNLITANDSGCMISGELKNYTGEISDFLGVKAVVGTLADVDLPGSLAICNSKGCFIHKGATKSELPLLEKALKVKAMQGTVNFGSPWVRSGIVANSRGLLIGDNSSGPEMGIAAEALGFV